MPLQYMALNSENDRKATKMRADTNLHNSLPDKGIPLKTAQTFLTIFWKLYSAVLKLIWRVEIPSVKKFTRYSSALLCFL